MIQFSNPEDMEQMKWEGRSLWIMRPYKKADYSVDPILTNSIFNFVDSWLQKNSKPNPGQPFSSGDNPLYYWRQACNFYRAADGVSFEVKPLLNYYCILNAVKALLCLNKKDVKSKKHGVYWKKDPSQTGLQMYEIEFLDEDTIHRQLREHVGDGMAKEKYDAKKLFYNLVCVHRAYTFTYKNEESLFLPVDKLKLYRKNGKHQSITITMDLVLNHDLKSCVKSIPSSIFQLTTRSTDDWKKIEKMSESDQIDWAIENKKFFIRDRRTTEWDDSWTDEDKIKKLQAYHVKIRPLFQYISADSPIWYLKKENPSNPDIINRSSMTITFALFHWLSELVRYNPEEFSNLVNKSECSWLITEFIEVGFNQFIDEIAAEITGLNIMRSGVRGNLK